jgi:MFS-type transporter involved in bile tolerance (Atg22 family)
MTNIGLMPGPRRKSVMLLCATISIMATGSLLVISKNPFSSKHLIGVLINVAVSVSSIICSTCHDAYIPIPARLATTEKIPRETDHALTDSEGDSAGEQTPLLLASDACNPSVDARSKFEHNSKRLSSIGNCLSYLITMMSLLGSSALMSRMGDSTGSLETAIAFSGLWWTVALVPAYLLLPTADDTVGRSDVREEEAPGLQVVNHDGPRHLIGRVTEARRLPNLYRFLAIYLLLGVGTSLTFQILLCYITNRRRPQRTI